MTNSVGASLIRVMRIIVVVEVTGSRKLENGLVIRGTFKAVTRSRRLHDGLRLQKNSDQEVL